MERMKTLSNPGAEEACQSHAGRTAFGAARPPADFAGDDQGTHTAFGQIVVRWHAGIGYEHKEFGQKALDSLTERMHGSLGLGKRCTYLPQFLLEGVLERHPLSVLFRDGELRVRCGSGFGSLVDLLDLFGPLPQLRIVRMQLFEIVDVTQEWTQHR